MKHLVKYLFAGFISISLLTLWNACSDDDESVGIKVAGMKIDNSVENTISLIEGDELQVSLSLYPEEAVDKEDYAYRFISENEKIFSVDERGLIQAMAEGEAALRIEALNNRDLWISCVVKVEKRLYPVTSIEIPESAREFKIGVDETFDLGSLIRVLPENASNPAVIYTSSDEMLATVDEYGVITTHAWGDVKIAINTIDGSGTTANVLLQVRNISYQTLDRTGWTVDTSHPYAADAAVVGTPESLIDDPASTSCLVLIKPGKTLNGVSIPNTDVVFFTIDMQQEQTFDIFQLRHRTNNTSANLRVTQVSAYGSNDGINYTLIADGLDISTIANEVTVKLPQSTYRHFKLTYDKWNNSGNTIQISNFEIGSIIYE